jgi:hypothetical protein
MFKIWIFDVVFKIWFLNITAERWVLEKLAVSWTTDLARSTTLVLWLFVVFCLLIPEVALDFSNCGYISMVFLQLFAYNYRIKWAKNFKLGTNVACWVGKKIQYLDKAKVKLYALKSLKNVAVCLLFMNWLLEMHV